MARIAVGETCLATERRATAMLREEIFVRTKPQRPTYDLPRDWGSGHAGVMWVGRFSSLWGRRAPVRCWADGGRLVWRRDQRPGRRSRSVSRRSPGGVLSSAARGAIDAVRRLRVRRRYAGRTGGAWPAASRTVR